MTGDMLCMLCPMNMMVCLVWNPGCLLHSIPAECTSKLLSEHAWRLV